MSKSKQILRQYAHEYRDQLATELARIDAFLAMAERLSDPADCASFDLVLLSQVPSQAEMH